LTLEITNQVGPAGWPEADRVFEKYYRSPHARRQTGSGLGLYLVRHLTQAIGGQIAYKPSTSQIRFVLNLPTMRATD
jgi:signal transduction histidine kinase